MKKNHAREFVCKTLRQLESLKIYTEYFLLQPFNEDSADLSFLITEQNLVIYRKLEALGLCSVFEDISSIYCGKSGLRYKFKIVPNLYNCKVFLEKYQELPRNL